MFVTDSTGLNIFTTAGLVISYAQQLGAENIPSTLEKIGVILILDLKWLNNEHTLK